MEADYSKNTFETSYSTAQSRAQNIRLTQLVCFKLANEEYGVNINKVQEVIRLQQITAVPQMPSYSLGIVNIRGTVAPVFDLRILFGLQVNPPTEKTRIVVISFDNTWISFIVDEILDNIKLEPSQIDPSPNIKMHIERSCISGIGEIENRMIIMLDIETVHSVILDGIKDMRKEG